LAVRAAHQVREEFPDGQLYTDLRGTETHPVSAYEALARFLRALGIDGASIPEDIEERAALYRSLLANRRMLVLLDHAGTAAPLRPLVPGVPGCALLVTSRARITDLNGVRLVDLDILEPDQAVRLLARGVGEDRVSAQQDDAERIVRLCGYLPLAVVIAAARLDAHPYWRLSRLADALSDEQRRLDELSVGNLEVRASLTLSYDGLDAAAQRAFCLLGLLEAADVANWVAAALLDSSLGEAEPYLDQLVEAQLLEVSGRDATGQTRYQLHDLVRVFARERAVAEQSEQERSAAIERVIGAWLALAEQATRRVLGRTYWVAHGTATRWPLDKGDSATLLADPFAWFESERVALVAAVEQAAALKLDEFAWELASLLRFFLRVRGYLDDWRRTNELALSATKDAGNLLGAAVMMHGLGLLHAMQRRYEDALACLEEAGAGYAEAAELSGGARLMSDLGKLYYQLGRFDEATGCLEQAVRTFEMLNDALGAAHARCDLGHHHNKLGNSERALDCVEQAVHIFRGHGHLFGEAFALYVIGESLLDQGRPADARGNLDRALSVCRDAGYRFGEARALYQLGSVYNAESRLAQAVDCLERCLVIFDELGYRKDSAYAQQQLAMVYAGQGRRPDAQAMCQRCLQTFRELDEPHGEALTLRSLGELYHTESRSALAIACLKEALLLWQKLGLAVWQSRTLRILGAVHAATGDATAAQLAFREATELMQRSAGPRATDEAKPANGAVVDQSPQVDQPVEQ
ncbi:MAG: tetratricopeptide repeat protein, partial [Sciscionella sp.]